MQFDAPRDIRLFETFEHGADIGVRGLGSTLDAAFEQAALALTSVVCDPELVRPAEEIEVACTSAEPDEEVLLVAWLNAVIFEMATRSMLFSRFRVEIDGSSLRARIAGERVDVDRHRPAVEAKGATFTELRVRRGPDGSWRAECVIDV